MIPAAYLTKLGNYEVSIGGDAITVNVIKHHSILSVKLSELKTQLVQHRVVGIDAQASSRLRSSEQLKWLILCAGNRCLVIDLGEVNPIPECLKKFLADETICFVGIQMSNILYYVRTRKMECKSGVQLGYLAAQVMKKPNLENMTDLEGLTSEFGVQVDTNLKRSTSRVNWCTNVFSEEQMPRVICDPYYSYVVGVKLLGML